MEYNNNTTLFNFFKKEITSLGSLDINRLEKEISEVKNRELSRIRNEIEDNIDRFLIVELRSLNTDHSSEINKINNKNRRLLMQERQVLIENVFNDIIKKTFNYLKTNDYLRRMEAKLLTSLKLLNTDDIIITYNKNDEMIKKILSKANFKNLTKNTNDTILIGGFIASSVKKSIEINETIDVRLEEKKQWFFENSNLFIRN